MKWLENLVKMGPKIQLCICSLLLSFLSELFCFEVLNNLNTVFVRALGALMGYDIGHEVTKKDVMICFQQHISINFFNRNRDGANLILKKN